MAKYKTVIRTDEQKKTDRNKDKYYRARGWLADWWTCSHFHKSNNYPFDSKHSYLQYILNKTQCNKVVPCENEVSIIPIPTLLPHWIGSEPNLREVKRTPIRLPINQKSGKKRGNPTYHKHQQQIRAKQSRTAANKSGAHMQTHVSRSQAKCAIYYKFKQKIVKLKKGFSCKMLYIVQSLEVKEEMKRGRLKKARLDVFPFKFIGKAANALKICSPLSSLLIGYHGAEKIIAMGEAGRIVCLATEEIAALREVEKDGGTSAFKADASSLWLIAFIK
ncbi:hypothetical protein EGR_10671 [Echinococcus granulosus]|uniref:Uncharacterized protein n=1 Tax=Echinococcus granulosus TaxID=6210 RepID=W6U7W9_ECHGR|nr:hypothetical protein EGR_10671 [Echinococcus granulosus]EUB54472.1 hypothetical protein EGR_10671 [Echinococcus granulosus]